MITETERNGVLLELVKEYLKNNVTIHYEDCHLDRVVKVVARVLLSGKVFYYSKCLTYKEIEYSFSDIKKLTEEEVLVGIQNVLIESLKYSDKEDV